MNFPMNHMNPPNAQPRPSRPFAIRPMEERDVAQVGEVEKDAFPEQFPPTSFRRELRNRLARYLLLSRSGDPTHAGQNGAGLPPLPSAPDAPDAPNAGNVAPANADGAPSAIGRFMSGARRMVWRRRNPSWRPGGELVAGFVGLWYITDEAHIVAIGVRSEYRGLGLGEALMIAAIEQAIEREARVVTLEVRVSNHVAQNLYKKYGFTARGTRKGYYSDNREDALIMTSEELADAGYRAQLQRLAEAHEARWGAIPRRIA